jgi:Prolyl oligopeptidase family
VIKIYIIITLFFVAYEVKAASAIEPEKKYVSQSVATDIEQFYRRAYQKDSYEFFGDRLFKSKAGGWSKATVFAAGKTVDSAAPKFSTSLQGLKNISSFACMNEALTSCIFLHDSNGLQEKVAVIKRDGDKYQTVYLPIQVVSYYPNLARIDNKGWLVVSLATGKTIRILADGSYQEIEALAFNASIDHVEVRNVWGSPQYSALVIVANKEGILSNRVEKSWIGIGKNYSTVTFSAPAGCQFEGIIERTFACSTYSAKGEALLRLYRETGSQDLTLWREINLGNATVQRWLRKLGNGFIVPLIETAQKKVRFFSLSGKNTTEEKRLNHQIEELRNDGHLSLLGMSASQGQLLFSRTNLIRPIEILLTTATDAAQMGTERGLTLSQSKVLVTGDTYFDPKSIRVKRLVQQARGVPYTVVFNPNTIGYAAGKTIISVYGSYGLPLAEGYLKEYGKYWVNQGGTFVFAHVRGGGGFGRSWQQAGFGTKKKQSLLDLESIVDDLLEKGLATKGKISLQAHSAGGILAGAAVLRRPDFYDRVALLAPCLVLWDNVRSYCTQTNEFGNPTDPIQMATMRGYSPAHLLRQAKSVRPFFIVQSAQDPIVPPLVTDVFKGLRPDRDFIEHIKVDRTVHDDNYPNPDIRAMIAKKRLEFLIGKPFDEPD